MFVIDRSLYLSPEVVGEPGLRPLKEVDPFSLEALVAWLERQNPATQYDYCEPSACLLGQYVVASGGKYCPNYTIGGQSISAGGLGLRDNHPDLHMVASTHPWTLGAAKDRARKLLAEREK